ncbi:MAG: bacteriochlorophyll 4-vinyl reductase [Chloroflexaceae bacterium]|nr:bacteriochlorophyll 4-vinyl reductase [Chloroflexaceae bacterium]
MPERQPVLAAFAEHLPGEMVDEQAFYLLVQHLMVTIGGTAAAELLGHAGRQTADYLLVHRIPYPFQRIIKPLPPRVGLWLLLQAIRQHAWTFVGSGTFRFVCLNPTRPPTLDLTYAPTVPVLASHFYGGTFARLFAVLINPHSNLEPQIEHEHDGNGAGYLRFRYTLR